eukprot:38576-Pleurochrysis_carterae.AAC.1
MSATLNFDPISHSFGWSSKNRYTVPSRVTSVSLEACHAMSLMHVIKGRRSNMRLISLPRIRNTIRAIEGKISKRMVINVAQH